MPQTNQEPLDPNVHDWLDKVLTISRVSLEVNGSMPTVAFTYWPNTKSTTEKDVADKDNAIEEINLNVSDASAIPNMPQGAIIQLDCATQPRKESSFKALRGLLSRHKAEAVVILTEAETMADTGETQVIQDSGLVLCTKVRKQPCLAIQMEAKGRYFLGQVILVRNEEKVTFGQISLEEVGLDELPDGCTTRLLERNEKSNIVTGTPSSVNTSIGAQLLSSKMRVDGEKKLQW